MDNPVDNADRQQPSTGESRRDRRPSATVVVVGSDWQRVQPFLDTVRDTLERTDTVSAVLVDHHEVGDDALAGIRSAYHWATFHTPPRDEAIGEIQRICADVSTDAVVLVDAGVAVQRRWLDGLLSPIAAGDADAAGPRLTRTSNDNQRAGLPRDIGTRRELREIARAWRDTHRGAVTATDALDAPCIAMATPAAGTLDVTGGSGRLRRAGATSAEGPLSAFSTALVRAGRRMVVADEVLVHVLAGHETLSERSRVSAAATARPSWEGPLLSACMIVRDEAEMLPQCLASLARLVDEIVIYDTGSTDDTVALARRAGATVVEGHWDDDFARARNAALEACKGEWVLHVDADEVVECDKRFVRQFLADPATTDMLTVEIVNLNDEGTADETAYRHRGARMFRRERGRWLGRLHEQVVARDGQAPLTVGHLRRCRIVHHGYLADIVEARGKKERNLRLALADAPDEEGLSPKERDQRRLNIARSLNLAGEKEKALDAFQDIVGDSHDDWHRRVALRQTIEILLELNRVDEALTHIAAYRELSDDSDLSYFLEGWAWLNKGEHAKALACFERVENLSAESSEYPEALLYTKRGTAYAESEQWSEASREYLEVARILGTTWGVWPPLVNVTWKAGGDAFPAVAEVVPQDEDARIRALTQLRGAVPEAADGLLEAVWALTPGDPVTIAAVVPVAVRLPLERQLDWSARLRERGAEAYCPLMAAAEDPARSAPSRLQAAAVAHAAFADDRAGEAMGRVAAAMPAAEFEAALAVLDDLAPALLPAFVAGAITTPRRAFAMGDLLTRCGADEEGASLVRHALENAGTDESLHADAAAWLAAHAAPAN